jgi:ribosome-associated toxin RatA of RatAB toxin-antitoxin module
MKKHGFIHILIYFILLYFVLNGSTADSKSLDWDKLSDGDIIVDTTSNREGIPGIKLIMTVTASRERIWETLTDYENFSNVFKGIEDMRVIEQDDQGAYVEFWIDAVFTKYHYILYRHYEKPQERLRWKRVSGDIERIEGSWEIHDTPRPGTQLLIYTSYVKVESAIPESWMRWGAIRKARAMGRHLRKTLEALPSED